MKDVRDRRDDDEREPNGDDRKGVHVRSLQNKSQELIHISRAIPSPGS